MPGCGLCRRFQAGLGPGGEGQAEVLPCITCQHTSRPIGTNSTATNGQPHTRIAMYVYAIVQDVRRRIHAADASITKLVSSRAGEKRGGRGVAIGRGGEGRVRW